MTRSSVPVLARIRAPKDYKAAGRWHILSMVKHRVIQRVRPESLELGSGADG